MDLTWTGRAFDIWEFAHMIAVLAEVSKQTTVVYKCCVYESRTVELPLGFDSCKKQNKKLESTMHSGFMWWTLNEMMNSTWQLIRKAIIHF